MEIRQDGGHQALAAFIMISAAIESLGCKDTVFASISQAVITVPFSSCLKDLKAVGSGLPPPRVNIPGAVLCPALMKRAPRLWACCRDDAGGTEPPRSSLGLCMGNMESLGQ